jgi:arylsulfatase A
MLRTLLHTLSLFVSVNLACASAHHSQPNVVIILADDLGYGDVGCFGAELIATPHIDRLAAEGMRFTRAYTPCSVCSPTRYGLLTGRYYWRSKQHPPTKVIQDGQGLCIEEGRETLATLFKKKGYATGIVGKWHLGFGKFRNFDQQYDWTKKKPIGPGPLDVGFDYYFGMAANVGNQPRFFIENRDFHGRKPGDKVSSKSVSPSNPAAGQFMVQKENVLPWDPAVVWQDEEVSQVITDKAVEFIGKHSGADKPPFFLYFAHNIPHGPITPSNKFVGSSKCGPYGDFIQELDAQVGQVMDAVKEARRHRETIVIFTSDNGGVATAPESRGPATGEALVAQQAGHKQVGDLRGSKWSIYEGGFRVPFIVNWPGQVGAGQSNDKLISLVDLFATVSDLLGMDYGSGHGEDSFSFWAQLIDGPQAPAARDHVIVQSPLGVRAIVRDGWKYIRPWQVPDKLPENQREWLAREMDNPENYKQLYHLTADPAEETNVLDGFSTIATQLKNELEEAERLGRTSF